VPVAKTVNNRKAGKAQTRRQLIRSAHALLLEKGIAGLSMNQISRAAGIAQPSFYNHFASVTELAIEVRHRMADKYLQPQQVRLESLLERFTPGHSDLRELIHSFLTFNFEMLMRDVDVLISPTRGGTAMTFDQAYQDYFAQISYTAYYNMTGFPALSVLCGFDSQSLPIGLQLGGRPFEEATLLRVGYAYEQVAGWIQQHPSI